MSPSVGRTYVPNPLSFFKKDQIDVKLQKYSYTPGETIKGSVGLKLKRPLTCKKTHCRVDWSAHRPSGQHRDRTSPGGQPRTTDPGIHHLSFRDTTRRRGCLFP